MGDEPRVLLLGVGREGGGGQYSAQLANGLSKHIGTTVLLPDYESTEFEKLLNSSVEVYRFEFPFEGGLLPGRDRLLRGTLDRANVFRSIVRQIDRIDPDIVHMPFYTQGPLRAYFLPVLKVMGLPVVGTVHDPMSHSGQRQKVLGLDLREKVRVLGGLLLDKVFVHGPGTRKQAIEAGYPEERIEVVPHGIYQHFPETNSVSDDMRVLFYGNIERYKGYDRVPAIAERITEACPDVAVTVAGSLPEDDEWSETISQQLRGADAVDLDFGYISLEQTAEYFSRATLVILPYYDATSSGVLMTAYRYRTPVVVTDVGDLPHYVKNDGTGLVADADSTVDIVEKTIQLLEDDQKRKEKAQNMDAVNDNYSWRNIAAQTVSVYRETL